AQPSNAPERGLTAFRMPEAPAHPMRRRRLAAIRSARVCATERCVTVVAPPWLEQPPYPRTACGARREPRPAAPRSAADTPRRGCLGVADDSAACGVGVREASWSPPAASRPPEPCADGSAAPDAASAARASDRA